MNKNIPDFLLTKDPKPLANKALTEFLVMAGEKVSPPAKSFTSADFGIARGISHRRARAILEVYVARGVLQFVTLQTTRYYTIKDYKNQWHKKQKEIR